MVWMATYSGYYYCVHPLYVPFAFSVHVYYHTYCMQGSAYD